MQNWRLLMAVLFAGTLFMLHVGCESSDTDSSGVDEYFEANPYQSELREDPDPTQLQVFPSKEAISIVGQELLFTAKGGTPSYRWSVTDSSKGLAEVVGYSQCRYVCLQVGNNTLRVEDQDGHFALAQIAPEVDTMTISPASVELVNVWYAAFTVNGGSPPYVWSVGNPALGTISYSSSSTYQVAYNGVYGAYGENVITVRDADGHTASAIVTQLSE